MYAFEDLKYRVPLWDAEVACPVAGCENRVPKQRSHFVASSQFMCAEHGIYVSPSTFEYADVRRNFPLVDDADWDLLITQIAANKRETHRLARERSEDAVSYNCFRTVERSGLLPDLVAWMVGSPQAAAKMIYWSHDLEASGTMPLLSDARRAFGELEGRGSEPDLIVSTPTDLVFIEVKLASGNNTKPSRPEVLPQYRASAHGWYDRVFASPPEAVAIAAQKYELMRFWLLGSWMAAQVGTRFTLVSLTRGIQDMDLESRFAPFINQSDGRRFLRRSWEEVAEWTLRDGSTRSVAEYLGSKTVGYDSAGRLQRMLAMTDY